MNGGIVSFAGGNTPMNSQGLRVIDPINSEIARGYRQSEHVWHHLFPIARVLARAGKILTFGAEDFAKRNLRREPGSERQRYRVGYSDEPYAIQQTALDGEIPIEHMQEAEAVPGVNLRMRAVTQTMAAVSLQTEITAGELATTPGQYSANHRIVLAGNDRWDNDNSNPARAVEDRKNLVRQSIGMDPNVLVLGNPVYRALRNHPDIIDRVKHVTGIGRDADAVITVKHLAEYFDVDKVVVGNALTGEPGNFEFIWNKVAVLAYVSMGSSIGQAEGNMAEPSYGHAYRLDGYPLAEAPWEDKNCDSWRVPVTDETQPVITGKDGGVLYTSVVE